MCIISLAIVSRGDLTSKLVFIRIKKKTTDHFHVHIVNANYLAGMMGMTVGQAHLLDDIISLVSLHCLNDRILTAIALAGAGSRRGSRNLRTNDTHIRVGRSAWLV